MRKKKIIIITIIIIALIPGAYFIFKGDNAPVYEFISAKKGEVLQEVSVIGIVRPAHDVDLAFEKGGKVSSVKADVGDKVSAGQILAVLYNLDIIAQLEQVQANLKDQEAKFEELKKGTRPEELSVYQTKVDNAKTALEEKRKSAVNNIQDAYTKSEDAVRNKTDQFFSNPRGSNPQLILTGINGQLKTDVEWGRFLMEGTLVSWNLFLNNLTVSGDLDAYIDTSKKNMEQAKNFLDDTALAVNSLTPNSSLTQTTIDTYKSNVSTARTNVNTAIANLTSAQEELKSAKATLLLAEQDLLLKKAGPTAEQLTSQEAQIEGAKASVSNYEAQVAKTILRAPINGIVTKQEAKVGEILAAGVVIVSVISESQFEIEANIPETDIAKIRIGNEARITLDAYGNDSVFEARVVKIDPAETIIEGVATYKITLQFIKKDERPKSGMTANIDILADKREKVIYVPQKAVTVKDGEKTVEILLDEKTGATMEAKVKTGLRGSDGSVEIIEGIKEGDKVITFKK